MTEFARGCITGFFFGIGLVFMFGVFLYVKLDSIKGVEPIEEDADDYLNITG